MIEENIHIERGEGAVPGAGKSLIANPFLKDPHFSRSVIYLCDHSQKGSFGFAVNKLYPRTLNELLPDVFSQTLKVFVGGPVQMDTIHFLHQCPELIDDGLQIQQGVYWGGNFEQMTVSMNEGLISEQKIKFFIGYSGWSAGQLDNELGEDSWIVCPSRKKLLFELKEADIWPDYLKSMGEEYARMINYPIDPSLN